MFTAQCFLFQKTRTDQRWCWSQRLHLSVWTTTPKTPTLWWGEAITDRLVGSGLHIVREVSFSLLPGLFTYTCVLFSVLGYPERDSASGVFFFGAQPQRPSVQDHMAAVQDWNRCLLCLHRWTGRLIDGLANPLKPFKITLYLSVCLSGFVVGCPQASWAHRVSSPGPKPGGEPGPSFRGYISGVWAHHGESCFRFKYLTVLY